jgi:dTDP-glucose 4,6-dehydratase
MEVLKKNILVLGSNSFSGSNFINFLLSEGKKVIGVSRSPEADSLFLGYANNKNLQNFKFYQYDLNNSSKEIVDLCLEFNISSVVNFAAQSMVAQSWESPSDWYNTNIVSFANFLKMLSNCNNLESFVNFSTPEVYGSTDNWIKESFDFSPTTPYAISRAAADYHLKGLFESFNFPVIFTRAANVYGPGQQLYRIVPKAILFGILGNKIPLQGGGSSIRSFIHIDDVSKALIAILDKGIVGDSYHISTNNLITIKDLLKIIASKLSIEFEDLINEAPDRAGKDFAYKLLSNKIRDELGWADTIPLETGIDQTITWIKDNIELLEKLPMEYKHKR